MKHYGFSFNLQAVVKGEDMSSKYGKKAQEEVAETMHEYKHEGKFKNRKQAIAVGLNKAREAGGKVPKK